MSVKLRQITDNIHETIYLSELESEFISTPYFFRLHDVYQSSTVYMTYPSNRTKRYEHSVGTMELASDLLFSSVANADTNTRNELFKQLKAHFWKIYQAAFQNANTSTAKYYTLSASDINDVISSDPIEIEKDFFKSFEKDAMIAFKSGILNDRFFERYHIANLSSEAENKYRISATNDFLFRCLFEAIRIVALFHDAGHPPYSHIIETVITELYKDIQNEFIEGFKERNQKIKVKKEYFLKCVKPYVDKGEDSYKTSMLLTNASSVSADFHERVGLALLQSAINEVIPESIKRVSKSVFDSEYESNIKLVGFLYYITVAEFAICILTEEDKFFKSFHRIVDGFIDADRLDYVVRDSVNSGVHWNKIPYKRVIDSAKLFYDKESKNGSFLLAFTKKNQRDIIDFLITRYKVFTWINYHHRCMRTSVAMQSCVKSIAIDYLNSNETKNDTPLCPDIKILWDALNNNSQGYISRRIIQWNDSWLITTLQKAFVDLCKRSNSDTRYSSLKMDLEEIILNKKKLYAIMKRGSDSVDLVREIFTYAGITEELMDRIVKKEKAILIDPSKPYDASNLMKDEKYNAKDSIMQIERLRYILKTGNLEMFYTTMPLFKGGIDEIIDSVLKELVNTKRILGYRTLLNIGKSKYGIPKGDSNTEDVFQNIYFFDDDSKPYPMDVSSVLLPQLSFMSNDSPYMFIYITPPDNIGDYKLSKEIINELAKAIGGKLHDRFVLAFPNSAQECINYHMVLGEKRCVLFQ